MIILATNQANQDMYWNRKIRFFKDIGRINRVREFAKQRAESGKSNLSKRFKKIAVSLKRITDNNSKFPSQKKLATLKDFHNNTLNHEANHRFSALYLFVNQRYISPNSHKSVKFLDERHEREKTNHIVEALPSVLGCSLDRTKRVYKTLETKTT